MSLETHQGRGSPEVAACEVAAALQHAGHEALFAGGCVRDRELGLGPDDFDIATSATSKEVQSVFPRARGVGEFFGVMLVRNHGWPIQVATFRTEGPYSDHRRPDHVEVATREQDAARRDFTINGMYWDPIKEERYDPFDGKQDLVDGVIRAIGDPLARLDEDHLRMLRAVRFAARLSFQIHPDTKSAIQSRHDRLDGISRERIGEEVRRMLLNEHRGVAASLLEELGLAEAVLGEPAPSWTGRRHLDSLPSQVDRAGYPTALAAWALDRGEAEATVSASWRPRLMLSNEDRDGLHSLLEIATHLRTKWDGLPVAGQKRLASRSWFEEAVALVGVLDPARAEAVTERVDALRPSGLAPPRLLGGTAMLEAGLEAGPRFSEIIEAIYDAQLEGRVSTPDEALDLARKLWEKGLP